MQTAASNYFWFVAGRFVSGYALCVVAVAVQIYNAEVSPPEIRGRVVGLQQLMVALGIAVSYWVNYFVNANTDWNGNPIQFKLPLGLQVIPPVVLIIGLLSLPKSPRWLATKDRYAEARSALSYIRGLDENHHLIDEELQEMSSFLESTQGSTWTEVFGPKNLTRLWVGVPLILFQQFAGQNVINYFSPELFHRLGLNSNQEDLFATGLVGILKIVMTVPALYVVDRLGRRPLMIIGTIIMASSFYYIGTFNAISPGSGSLTVGGYFAIASIYLFMAGYAISWGIIHYVLPSEIYPLNIRAKAQSIGAVVDWGFQVVSIKIYPYIIGLSNGGLYFVSAGLLTLFLVWIVIFLPETKGLGLEDVDLAFDTFPRWRKVKKRLEY